MTSVAAAIRAALLEGEPIAKAMASRAVTREWNGGRLSFSFDCPMPDRPARPLRPELLAPNQMPRRGKGGSERGRIALWHALAHIEFVAIDLALDMAGRFGAKMGEGFVGNFLSVAADEASHFMMLVRKLRSLGAAYGDLPAHDGLWEAAHGTRHDVEARLAVVPMVLEARGLDVTPMMIQRVRSMGDKQGVRLLERILDDEIRHVRIGTNHFTALALQRQMEPGDLWRTLVSRYFRGHIKQPFNDSARRQAGLSREVFGEVAIVNGAI